MQILIMAAVLAAAITATTSITVAVAPARSESVLVKAVLDGDTIEVQLYGRVRLIGIEAPRIGRGGAASASCGWRPTMRRWPSVAART